MATKVVFHIGPGKCGSSTIQGFFHDIRRPGSPKSAFREIHPDIIKQLHQGIEISAFRPLEKELTKLIKRHELVILSHEVFFQCPQALVKLCAFVSQFPTEIQIIGYSRKQSQWLNSAFSQWIFRSQERLLENEQILLEHQLRPTAFTALEQHAIAAVLSDFKSARQLSNVSLLNWHEGYNHMQSLVAPFNASLKVGVVPTAAFPFNLIQDFCKKAGLTIKEKYLPATTIRSNSRFHPQLVEAISVGVKSGMISYHPHQQNDALFKLSKQLPKEHPNNAAFMSVIEAYIDGYFATTNQQLTTDFGLPDHYFAPAQEINKASAIAHIKTHMNKRLSSQEMVHYYMQLSASLLALNLKHS